MGQPYVVPYQTGTAYTDQGAGGRSQGDWQAAIMTPVTSATLTGTENAYGMVDSQGRVAQYYPSAARTATPYSPALYTRGTQGVQVVWNVTAVSGTPSLTLHIQGFDPASASWYDILVSAATATVSQKIMTVALSVTPATNLAVSTMIPDTMRIQVVHGTTDSVTYSVSLDWQ